MTRASTPTLLALDRYAKLLGISPAHFSGAYVSSPDLFPYGNNCNDRWHQYNWQSGQYVSREYLAEKIAEVEEELARFVGYWAAPTYLENEPHLYPTDYDPLYANSNYDLRGQYKGVTLDFGRFVQAGKRVCTLVANVVPAYSDADADTFSETATVSIATAVTDVNQLKVYYTGHTEPEWEIRPARTKVLAGGVVTFTFYTWQFIKPELDEVFPPGPVGTIIPPIDLTAPNLLTTVDVCREYIDSTQTSAKFYWEPTKGVCQCCGGTGCAACTHYEQEGCLFARDIYEGIVGVSPATYDSTTGAWVDDKWDLCRTPDIVKLNYLAGDIDERYLRGKTFDPLSDFWAIIIAQMATARLEKPFCACGNLNEIQDELRADLTYTTQGESRYVTQYITNSPFGTRRGEVNAWRKVSKVITRRGKVAVI